jgi:hypothetical protein
MNLSVSKCNFIVVIGVSVPDSDWVGDIKWKQTQKNNCNINKWRKKFIFYKTNSLNTNSPTILIINDMICINTHKRHITPNESLYQNTLKVLILSSTIKFEIQVPKLTNPSYKVVDPQLWALKGWEIANLHKNKISHQRALRYAPHSESEPVSAPSGRDW